MTVGTFVLLALETAPILPRSPELAARAGEGALSRVLETDAELQRDRWQRIVIHTSREGQRIAARCHFVVGDGRVVARRAWREQSRPQHVARRGGYDYNADSIGICLQGDYTRDEGVSAADRKALTRLVRAVQRRCGIDRSLVYYHYSFTGRHRPARSFAEAVEPELLTIGG
ncbi:MAG: N-acetylmuramoyl-L-alanine amidase [Planctomycetota bacterium]